MSDQVCICSDYRRREGWVTRTCPVHDPLSAEQRAALVRHGYDPDAVPRGVSGGTETFRNVDGMLLRNRVCRLDDIEIDGHEGSDLDPGGGCIHCGREWSEIFDDDED